MFVNLVKSFEHLSCLPLLKLSVGDNVLKHQYFMTME